MDFERKRTAMERLNETEKEEYTNRNEEAFLNNLECEAYAAAKELLTVAYTEPEDIFVVGCSSSEVGGHRIGTDSSPKIAGAVFTGIWRACREKGLFLAAQCCEHLNRALVIEKKAQKLYRLKQVNAVPQPKAGGSFASAAYRGFSHPVLVEEVEASAGMDIGGTMIGMHLQRVAVPVRLSLSRIGEAGLICARTRPPFTGGERAAYDPNLM